MEFPDKFYILDVGFGTQLGELLPKVNDNPLWGTEQNFNNPETVLQVHLEFLRAGAEIIKTNTYQASVDGFMKYLNFSKEESRNLIKKAIEIAYQAKDQFLCEVNSIGDKNLKHNPIIFVSIGPYGAFLNDGSEYRGHYINHVDAGFIKNWHYEKISAIVESGNHFLSLETLPCQKEAELLLDLLHESFPATQFWISFQCKDNASLANGDSFADACLMVMQKCIDLGIDKNLLAVGINCTNPKFIGDLLTSANAKLKVAYGCEKKLSYVVMPNSGEEYSKEQGWNNKSEADEIVQLAPKWIELGAKFIGGCCRTKPSLIKDLIKYKHDFISSNLSL